MADSKPLLAPLWISCPPRARRSFERDLAFRWWGISTGTSNGPTVLPQSVHSNPSGYVSPLDCSFMLYDADVGRFHRRAVVPTMVRGCPLYGDGDRVIDSAYSATVAYPVTSTYSLHPSLIVYSSSVHYPFTQSIPLCLLKRPRTPWSCTTSPTRAQSASSGCWK